MTLLVSWVGLDDKPSGKKVSSLYIVADSRYSWNSGCKKYNTGKKVYACINYPEIFGFCGDVTLPSNIISQLVSQIDSNCFFDEIETIDSKADKIQTFISKETESFSKTQFKPKYTILYGTKTGNFEFSLYSYSYSQKYGLNVDKIDFPSVSSKIYSGGSGAKEFEEKWSRLGSDKDNHQHTTRNVFHCICETMHTIEDKSTGGKPQIVGLYRGGNGRIIGYVEDGVRYLNGIEYRERTTMNNVEWRNKNFEIVDPYLMIRKDGATEHIF